MLFDTNAISDLFLGVESLRPLIERHSAHFFPVIAVGEYRHGLERSTQGANLRPRFESLLATGTTLPITENTTPYFARLAAQQDRKGRPVPSNDLWIAALACEHRLPILSRDAHFRFIDGVDVLTW